MDYLKLINTSHGIKSKRSERIQAFKAEELMKDACGFFLIDLGDIDEKNFCVKLCNFSLTTHNNKHQDYRLELDEVLSAQANRDMNGKCMVCLIYNAIALDDQQEKIAFKSNVEYAIIDGEERGIVIAFGRLHNHPDLTRPIRFCPNRTMTYEQLYRYEEQLEQSDGFDVEYTDAALWSGQIAPINLSIEKDKRDKCEKMDRVVMSDYNRRFQGCKEKLHCRELLRAMRQKLDGKYYYLTFRAASDEKDARTCTLQAIVHVNFDGNTKVPFCRLNVGESLELLWDDRKRS